MKILKNLKTDFFIQKDCDSFYPRLIVEAVQLLSAIAILHMTDSLARIHFSVMHYCLLLLGLLSSVNHQRLSLNGECNQKENVVIAGNHTVTSRTEAFAKGNIHFQWLFQDSFVSNSSFLIKTFHGSMHGFKKNTLYQNSVSTRKM